MRKSVKNQSTSQIKDLCLHFFFRFLKQASINAPPPPPHQDSLAMNKYVYMTFAYFKAI